jgi:hypothetical protein
MSSPPEEARVISAPADDHADLFLETVRAAMDRRRWELGAETLEDLDDDQLDAVIEGAVQEAGAALGKAA